MNEDIAKLIELARPGQPDPFERLVEAVRQASQSDPGVVVEFARSAEELQRRVAIRVAVGRIEPEIVEAVTALARDPQYSVRQALVYALTDFPAWPLDQAVLQLLKDPDSNLRQAAIWCARSRARTIDALLERFQIEDNAWVRSEAAYALGDCEPRKVLPILMKKLGEDPDQGVQQACAASAEKHLAYLRGYPADLPVPSLTVLCEIRRRRGIFPAGGAYPQLDRFLEQRLAGYVDPEQLAGFGTLLTLEAEAGQLPRAYGVEKAIDAVLGIIHGGVPRAAVLVGEPGSGKTAVVQEITHRLREAAEPWYVLRMSPQDFMAHTRYLGEWETRVRNVLNAIRPPRRVLLYVPHIEELAYMGTWEKSEASVASALAPAIERGELTILGESTIEGFRKGLGANRSLRRLFHAIELQPADAGETRTILQSVARETAAPITDSLLERLAELADYFSAGTVQPGRSVGLLRRVLGLTAGRPGPITEQDILRTISTSTGIPVHFLDDGEALDRTEVRGFFEARVMGQPEAVDAVVDLVTLIKAGLTDPNKPFGVLFFVGPTGVGKTELARALAEQLFGDPARLIRLDMSEFATFEAFERLIGPSYRAAEPGLLTSLVRERPFSVLLFDEIEKAHPNIYNLCLQMFDAARLTDAQGRTADFHRTIIILTSNVGSSIPTEGGVGFARKTATLKEPPDREMILRELGRWFRPEFLNRLDRIVTFRPLAMETAEKIARREVAKVLERGGIARRHLAIDVDPEVLPLLLREGYSPAFGARPLKRTIERMVLLPVARAIAEGKVPGGSLLRLTTRQNRVDIEVEPPEPVESVPPPAARALPVNERAAHLLEKVKELLHLADPMTRRKSEILTLSAEPGFWDDSSAARSLMDEVYRLDGILTALTDLDKKLNNESELAQRQRHSERDLARIDHRLDDLENELNRLGFLVRCRDGQALGDALVTLRLVTAQGGGLESVSLLAKMYRNLADLRGWECQILDDRQGGEPPEDTITLLLSGPGAYALLAPEAGSHQVTRGRPSPSPLPKGEGKTKGTQRDIIRIEVLPVPMGEIAFGPGEVRSEVRPLGGGRGRLLGRLNHDVQLFHVPTMTAVRVWCGGPKSEAVPATQVILKARLDAQKPTPSNAAQRPPIVRRYRLGPTTLVKDHRSGKTTARLDQILEGNLDLFLVPPTE